MSIKSLNNAAALAVTAVDRSPALAQTELYSIVTLGEGFLDTVARHPDVPSLVIGERTYSYAQLAELAKAWALTLEYLGGGKRLRRIGVFGSRSEGVYGGVLASLMTGATFVPLNVAFPAARTAAMARAARLDALIVDDAALKLLEQLDADALPAVILAPLTQGPARQVHGRTVYTAEALLPADGYIPALAGLDDHAYILFTSGSTGAPKGVPITHRNIAHFLRHNLEAYAITSADRMTQTFDHTFDLAMFDMFMAWWGGATLCAATPLDMLAPARYITQKGITVWFSVPSVARLLVQSKKLPAGSFPGLRLSLFCGEALTRSVAEAWAAAAPNAVLENVYGPTELTIATSSYRWDPETSPADCHNDIVPVGKLYPEMTPVLLDEQDRVVAPGEIGELCVDGPQRFAGYLEDPVRTAKAFVEVDGRTYYRTGDLVFRNGKGDLAYVGRKDHQVKVGGFRIELGEIEGELRRLPGMIEAVVLAVKDPHDELAGHELVAFVMADGQTKDTIVAGLKKFLPNYMIPKRVVLVDGFPLNGNGKIDRKVLLEKAS